LHGSAKAGSFSDNVYARFVDEKLFDGLAHNFAVVG
jgi:hypothetical protein